MNHSGKAQLRKQVLVFKCEGGDSSLGQMHSVIHTTPGFGVDIVHRNTTEQLLSELRQGEGWNQTVKFPHPNL